MATVVLEAKTRESLGTNSAKASRRSGFVPAVVYGDGIEPAAICVARDVIGRYVHKANFFSTVFELDGVGDAKQKLVVKDVQFHPVTDNPIHIDFLRVSRGSRITVRVPLSFINDHASPGIKMGGVLNVLVHELDIVCDPDLIPDNISIDLTGFEFHHTVRASDIALTDGAALPAGGKNFTIATIIAPTVLKKEDETTAAAPTTDTAASTAPAK
ncbi:MAG: 50S ribosomal protein L25/general stress protein Ctc [Holosporaceae bacterium]|jgi:large subunit ribosomal protein L25|nr:50S ribosomal protein L25/general stress protein Ctc [Holosporaceae bacterium]